MLKWLFATPTEAYDNLFDPQVRRMQGETRFPLSEASVINVFTRFKLTNVSYYKTNDDHCRQGQKDTQPFVTSTAPTEAA